MGRYDSPLSVITLFLVATAVSVGLIYLIDAENESRLLRQGNKLTLSSPASAAPLIAAQTAVISSERSSKEDPTSSTTAGEEEEKTTAAVAAAATVPETTPGSSSHHDGIIGYFRDKLTDLFRRHHSVRKRRSVEEEGGEEDDEGMLLVGEDEKRKRRSAAGGYYDDVYGRNSGHNNIFGEKRNNNNNINGGGGSSSSGNYASGGGLASQGASPLITPPAFTSSSSSGFHKIRHAIKKLDGGGLDLSMVERMILDSNPGRFRPSSSAAAAAAAAASLSSSSSSSTEHHGGDMMMERKSNYHGVPYLSGSSSSSTNTAGSNTNSNHKVPNKFGLVQPANHHPDFYGSPAGAVGGGGNGNGAAAPIGLEKNPDFQQRRQSPGREKLENGGSGGSSRGYNMNSFSQDKISPSSSSSSSSERRGGDGKRLDFASYSSPRIDSSSNREVKDGGDGYKHRGNDNENDNSMHHVSQVSTTGGGIPLLVETTTTTTTSENSSGRKSSKVGNPLGHHHHHHGRGRNNTTSNRLGAVRQQQQEGGEKVFAAAPTTTSTTTWLTSSYSSSSPSSSSTTLSSDAAAAASEEQDSWNESSDFRQYEQQEGVNEKRRKTNHMNSRLGSLPAFDITKSHQEQEEQHPVASSESNHHQTAAADSNNNDTKRSILKEDVPICYKTDDVLIVVAITCCLNFAFVLVIWGCVRWFSISSTSKERDFHQLDCDDGGESVIFHEDQDHEDCCWRPGSPLNFDSHKCEHAGTDCLDMTHEFQCRESSRRRRNSSSGGGGHHCNNKLLLGNAEETLVIVPGGGGAAFVGMDDDNLKGSRQNSTLITSPLFPTCGSHFCESATGGGNNYSNNTSLATRLNSLRRKPSDRFHFYRQKQYQKNLKEFGLGFGPPLLSSSSSCEKSSRSERMPKTSASMHCFRKSDVPNQLAQSLKSHHHHNQKPFSHSMEDLRYFHT